MAGNWMDERDREMREHDWRRSEQYGRGGDYRGQDEPGRSGETRSFDDDSRFGAQRSGQSRDRVFGERETGANYSRGTGLTSGGGASGAGGAYGGGESYGRSSGGGRPSGYQSASQMSGGGYRGPAPRFSSQDYTQGGRYYGDDQREPIYREEYGQGGVEYGDVPRGYDAQPGRDEGRNYGEPGYAQLGSDRSGYGQSSYGGQQTYGGQQNEERFGYGERDYGQRYGGGYDRGYQGRMGPAQGGPTSGGTGGYDYERGYGDGGRGGRGGGRGNERFEDRAYRAGQDTGDFFQRAGEKITNWFRGDHLMQGSRPDDRRQDRRSYREDFGRERGAYAYETDRGHRGVGPKNYKRSDERINEEVHDRLTDDSWLDASNINVSVSGGEVTLSGTVENREAKHRAERLVEDISGVNHVQNNLRLAPSNPLTGAGRGYGDSMVDEQMRSQEASSSGMTGDASFTTARSTGLTGEAADKKKS